MGVSCGTYREQECCIHGFRWERKGKSHLEDLEVDGKFILK